MNKLMTKTKPVVLPEFAELMTSSQFELAFAVANELNIPVAVGPYLGTLDEPLVTPDMVYEPVVPGESTTICHIPEEAARRVRSFARSGVEIKQVIIAHETKKAYEPPAIDINWQAVRATLGILAAVAVCVAKVVAWVSVVAVAIPLMAVDPIVYIVLETGEWIEVARWDTL